MDKINPKIKSTIVNLLRLIVDGEYSEVEKLTCGVRLSAALFKKAVIEYGKTIVMPPASELERIDAIEVTNSNPRSWSVRVDLWAAEEGRSDLSLECTIIERSGGVVIEIDNLHVL